MLDSLSLHDTSGSLDFPSLTFLSLYAVMNLKHRMNVPVLTAYHEGGGTEDEEFPTPSPSLAEYGISSQAEVLPDVMKLHRYYPNLLRLSIRAIPSAVISFLDSFVTQSAAAVPMLGVLAVGTSDPELTYNNVYERDIMLRIASKNLTRKAKISVHFEDSARIEVPLFFGVVRVHIGKR